MKATVKVEGIEELQRELKKMSQEMKQEFKKEVYASALDVQKGAKEKLKEMKAWDVGNLANSITVELIGEGLTAEIGPKAPYGPYIEYGTKPHFPPPDALEEWARRHGFESAWPICIAISKRGTPARPYLFPAFLEVAEKFVNRIMEIIKR